MSDLETLARVLKLEKELDRLRTLDAAISSRNARFLARLNADILNVTGDGTSYTIIWDAEVYDDGSNFSLVTGQFTAPVTGRYHFDTAVTLFGLLNTHTDALLQLVTSNRTYRFQWGSPYAMGTATGVCCMVGSCDADMEAGDTADITIVVSGGTKVVDLDGHATVLSSFFSGHLIS